MRKKSFRLEKKNFSVIQNYFNNRWIFFHNAYSFFSFCCSIYFYSFISVKPLDLFGFTIWLSCVYVCVNLSIKIFFLLQQLKITTKCGHKFNYGTNSKKKKKWKDVVKKNLKNIFSFILKSNVLTLFTKHGNETLSFFFCYVLFWMKELILLRIKYQEYQIILFISILFDNE